MRKVTQSDTERGNTSTLSSTKKQRAWCITLNNYTTLEYDTITQHLSDEYIIGKEGNSEEKTQHLQIYFKYKNARSFMSMKKIFPRGHIEKAKGSPKDNYIYCSKEKDFITNMSITTVREKGIQLCLTEYENVNWYKYQLDVLEIIGKKPNNRSINWFWEKTGNIGKSYLAKYICLTNDDVIICDGKKTDVLNQINTMIEIGKKLPRIILLDVPRTSLEFINYGLIESIKGGLVYSGKYEGGTCIFPHPHVIIFANEPPNKDAMSGDRWNVIEIKK